jgi:heptosyltransferase-2
VGYARPWRNWFLTQALAPRPGQVRMRKRSVQEIKRLTAPGSAAGANGPGMTYPPNAHQIHEYLHLASALGADPAPAAPRLVVSPEEITAAAQRLGLESAPGQSSPPLWLGLAPGAEYGPAKRWPAQRFVAAAVQVWHQSKCTWLILGGPGDVAIAGQIEAGLRAAGCPAHNLAGRTSLRELCALLKSCRALLTNDSGPMHVAAALGTPVVVSFGSTSPELTAPGLSGDRRHQLLRAGAACAPCFLRACPIDFRCMTGISVERVVGAVMDAVQGQE